MYMIDKYVINVLKFNLKDVCLGTVSSIVILKGIILCEVDRQLPWVWL